jgi:hypothetical protein
MHLPNTLLIGLCLLLSSCNRKIRESFVDTRTGDKIGGYCNNCLFPVNRAVDKTKEENSDKIWYKTRKVGFDITRDSLRVLTSIGVNTETIDVATSRGLKPGDPISKARQLYGRPQQEKELFWEIGTTPYFYSNVFFYKGLVVYYSKEGVIEVISIGKVGINGF